MPLYVYVCPQTGDHEEHEFELIVPFSDYEKPKPCPHHGGECKPKELPGHTNWQWGKEVVQWDAGLSSNPIGLSRMK
jgi:hypothetical protein